jgi:hypothetical protein
MSAQSLHTTLLLQLSPKRALVTGNGAPTYKYEEPV